MKKLTAATKIEDLEGYKEIETLLNGKTDAVPVSLLAELICRVTSEMDWPVSREATLQCLKRVASARRDGLVIANKPSGGKLLKSELFGCYTTRCPGEKERPYIVTLRQITPLDCSCSCQDFLHSSLGICKHIFAVLNTLYKDKSPKTLSLINEAPALKEERCEIVWNPVAPATGEHDPLAQIFFRNAKKFTQSENKSAWRARKWFKHSSDEFGGELKIKDLYSNQHSKRLKMVEDISSYIEDTKQSGDSALLTILSQERERLLLLEKYSVPRQRVEAALRSLKEPLFPYQIEAVAAFCAKTRLLLGDDMGLGKTRQAIACCHVLAAVNTKVGGLVIVPASLKGQWLQEWSKISNVPLNMVDAAARDRINIYSETRSGFLLVNYEQVIKDLDPLLRWNPDLVVLDEGQRIKNWQTKTSTYIRLFPARYRLILTGTPFENRLDELATLMDWINPQALQPRWRLTPWHARTMDGDKEVAAARNLDTLRIRLAPHFMRRRRKEVLSQLPKRQDTNISVNMTPAQLAEHDALSPSIVRLMSIAKKRPLTQVQFLSLMSLFNQQRIICNGLAQLNFDAKWDEISQIPNASSALFESLDSPKLSQFTELLYEMVINQERKVVVFSQWRRMLKLAQWAIKDLLNKRGLESRFFTGEESQKRRRDNVIDFHDDARVMVLFLTDAGGVGLNLQRAASCCINLDLPWNPAVLEQRIGRIYRLGQTKSIDVYNLISHPGIEARISSIIGNKQALFSGLFDGTSDEVKFEGNAGFMSQLEKIVEPIVIPESAQQLLKQQEDVVDEIEDLEQNVNPTIEQELSDRLPIEGQQINDSSQSSPKISSPSSSTSQDLSQLFSEMRVERNNDGRLTISAPSNVAPILAQVFESFAKMLRA
jgi:superfamily II DNA or RNA helicase